MIIGSRSSEWVIKKGLQINNQIQYQGKRDKYIFTNCRNAKPSEIQIWISPRSPNWQIGFFDADGEVYFNTIEIGPDACFSSIVRNYWWNGKEGNERKEGYYSLTKLIKQLKIKEKHVNDLLDYVEGRYEAGEHWQIHELDKNIELRIQDEVKETTVERLLKHFDNIWRNESTADLKIMNNITCNCNQYKFKKCKEVVPQKLVINATIEYILCFQDAVNEIHTPEVVMEKKADLKSIIQNEYGYNKYYSILPHVQTLVIRNNQKVLCDLVDYINGKYKINYGWRLYQLNKNMNIVIEKPAMVFSVVKELVDYFVDVLVDGNNPQEYLARQQPYQKSFQEHFNKYNLKTDQIENFIPASQKLKLEGWKLNVENSRRNISQLHVNQEIAPQQLVCFHDTDEPVVIDKIVIEDDGDLRCVLQNAYYNETDSGFFSLLQTVKELDIHSNYTRDNQALVDLADYIEGKYALNTNWKHEELNKDMIIRINNGWYCLFLGGEYSLSLGIARRLRKYFRNVSVDYIQTPLETENIIDQECEKQYIFGSCRDANPQKLVVNAKLKGSEDLILFNRADSKVCIPEITIGEYGSFDTIVRDTWWNRKKGDESKYGYYSLVSYVETLTIQNNPEAVRDLDNYVSGNYKTKSNKWKVKKFGKNVIIRINGINGLDKQINRLKEYFSYMIINDRKSLRDNRQQMLININSKNNDIHQKQTQNNQKQQSIDNSVTSIQDVKQKIERARARLGRRRARFREYLALTE